MTMREAITLLERKLARRRRLNARDPYPGVMKVSSISLTFHEADALVALLRGEGDNGRTDDHERSSR
jgi:hypothetical protein